MQLSRRRERQRRNLPCPASPAECRQGRRESLLRPCHNFSIGRHLWFGPMRSPPQQRMVELLIECCSDRATTFACGLLQSFFEILRGLGFCGSRGRAPTSSALPCRALSLFRSASILGCQRVSFGGRSFWRVLFC